MCVGLVELRLSARLLLYFAAVLAWVRTPVGNHGRKDFVRVSMSGISGHASTTQGDRSGLKTNRFGKAAVLKRELVASLRRRRHFPIYDWPGMFARCFDEFSATPKPMPIVLPKTKCFPAKSNIGAMVMAPSSRYSHGLIT